MTVKRLTEIAANEGLLYFRAEFSEACNPRNSFPGHLGMVRVDTTRPRPSRKEIRNEDPSRSMFVAIFLGGKLFVWCQCTESA